MVSTTRRARLGDQHGEGDKFGVPALRDRHAEWSLVGDSSTVPRVHKGRGGCSVTSDWVAAHWVFDEGALSSWTSTMRRFRSLLVSNHAYGSWVRTSWEAAMVFGAGRSRVWIFVVVVLVGGIVVGVVVLAANDNESSGGGSETVVTGAGSTTTTIDVAATDPALRALATST